MGFTLMELLLVVAILAIVAAAASPTFFGGAQEALDEARKASFLSAYQNTISGANIALSMTMGRGLAIANDGLIPKLLDYVPIAARTFKNSNSTADYTFTAIYNNITKEVDIYIGVYKDRDTEPDLSYQITDNSPNGLSDHWNYINTL